MARRTTPADVIRSIAFYLVFYGGSILLVVLVPVFGLFGVSAVHQIGDRWSAWHRWCVTNLLAIKMRLIGTPPEPGVLVALKHESYFEAIDLPRLLRRPVVFAKAELLEIPIWGPAGARYGLVAVEREAGANALRRMITAARAYLGSGRPYAIFPEGTRVAHGTKPELQAGFAGLYKLLGVPVVPVAINSGPLYHRWWKRSGTITFQFGEPIEPGLPRVAIEARVHAAINALNR